MIARVLLVIAWQAARGSMLNVSKSMSTSLASAPTRFVASQGAGQT